MNIFSLGLSQEIRVQESSTSCDSDNKGLLRMVEGHLEFCDGKSWVRLSDEMTAQNSRENAGQQMFASHSIYKLID